MKISDILKNHENDLKNGVVTESFKKDLKQYKQEDNYIRYVNYKYLYRCFYLNLMLYITNKDIRSDFFESSILYYFPEDDLQYDNLDKKELERIKEEQFNNAKNDLGIDLDFDDYKNLNTFEDIRDFINRLDGDK